MDWNSDHRYDLYHILDGKRAHVRVAEWEDFKKSLGIEVMILKSEVHDAPTGTVAVWESTEEDNLKRCWIVPDQSALKLLVLGAP